MIVLRALRLGLILTVLLSLGVARGQGRAGGSSRALEHFGRGVVLYNAHDYAKAAAAFAAAYGSEPRRDFLFAWAQAERLAGNCPAAVRLYRQLLGEPTPPQQATVIKASLARCGETGPFPEPPPAPVAPPAATQPASAAAASQAAASQGAAGPGRRDPRAWYRDPLGGALFVGGLASIATSVGLFVAASADDHRANDQPTYRDFARYSHRAGRLRLGGWITLGAGGVLIVAGVLRYALKARRPPADAGALRLSVDGGMIGLAWR